MNIREIANDLVSRAQKNTRLAYTYTSAVDIARCLGKASAYQHAADLLLAHESIDDTPEPFDAKKGSGRA